MQSTAKLETSLKLKEHCFEWTINNWTVSSLMEAIVSEPFAIPDLNSVLRMALSIQDDGLLVIIYFGNVACLQKCCIEVYILIDKQKIKLSRISGIDPKVYCSKSKTCVVFETQEKYKSSNELTCLCEMKYGSDGSSEVHMPYDEKMNVNDFGKLFSDQKFCDVVFLTGKEEISAHIAVLVAVSPYFFAMFDNPCTIENQKRIVDFKLDKDVTPNNLRGFLEFIYGGKSIIELSSIASELLILADKFEVQQLRNTCECYMSENIDEENVVDILILSEKYHCELLKRKAIAFAKIHIDAVKESDKFNELCKFSDMIRSLL